MTFRLVRELAGDGFSVAAACRVLDVSRSGFYDWSTRPPSARAVANAELTATIVAVHQMSRCSYGAPRGHAELRLGMGIACGRKRVARKTGHDPTLRAWPATATSDDHGFEGRLDRRAGPSGCQGGSWRQGGAVSLDGVIGAGLGRGDEAAGELGVDE